MRKSTVRGATASVIVAILLFSSTSGASAGPPPLVVAFNEVDAKGEQMTGPATITVTRVNPLRYDNARLATDQQLDAVVDVASVFGGVFGAGTGSTGKTQSLAEANKTAIKISSTSDDPIGRILFEYSDALKEVRRVVTQVDSDAQGIASTVLLVDEYLKSDKVGKESSVTKSIQEITNTFNAVQFGSTSAGATLDWPAQQISKLHSDIVVQQQIYTISTDKDAPPRLKALAALAKQIDSDFGDASPLKKDYDTKTAAILKWRPVFAAAQSADRFQLSKTVGCPGQLQSSHTTVTFKATDRLDIAKTTEVSKSITTVNCYSALALTHGAMFTSIPDRSFAVGAAPSAPGSSTTVQTVQYTKNTPDHLFGEPALLHYRILGDVDHTAVHFSLGVPDQSQAVAGLTVSFGRTLFLTAAAVRAQTTSITNGFAIGQTVPSGTALTTTTGASTRMGFGISIPLSASLAGGKTQTTDTSKDTPPATTPASPAPRRRRSRRNPRPPLLPARTDPRRHAS